MNVHVNEVLTPKQALEKLINGNKRFSRDQMEHPNRNLARREAIVANQKPFATIVGCADSRVSPEIIFDQGVGDIFVVRVAGNVIGPLELDSIDYAALVLNSLVILVVGHENCGAVTAVMQNQAGGIKAIAKLIQPAVDEARSTACEHEVLPQAIKLNAVNMKNYLIQSDVISRLIKEKGLEVHAAYFNLQTGEIEILD